MFFWEKNIFKRNIKTIGGKMKPEQIWSTRTRARIINGIVVQKLQEELHFVSVSASTQNQRTIEIRKESFSQKISFGNSVQVTTWHREEIKTSHFIPGPIYTLLR
jgi:hypothetical protein